MPRLTPAFSALGATALRRRTTSSTPAWSPRKSSFEKNARRTTRTPSARQTLMLSLTQATVRGSLL